MKSEKIMEARTALQRARTTLLTLADEYDARAIENALARTDEALGWIGRVHLDTKRRTFPNEDFGVEHLSYGDVKPGMAHEEMDFHCPPPDRDPTLL